MSELMKLIKVAESEKPKMGDACNHCGWCCLTEVCQMGKEITGTEIIPCALLEKRDDGFYCSVANTAQAEGKMAYGVGCCAMTQQEALARLMG